MSVDVIHDEVGSDDEGGDSGPSSTMDDTERLFRSRVLVTLALSNFDPLSVLWQEIDTKACCVDNVLAARDPEKLRVQLRANCRGHTITFSD